LKTGLCFSTRTGRVAGKAKIIISEDALGSGGGVVLEWRGDWPHRIGPI